MITNKTKKSSQIQCTVRLPVCGILLGLDPTYICYPWPTSRLFVDPVSISFSPIELGGQVGQDPGWLPNSHLVSLFCPWLP